MAVPCLHRRCQVAAALHLLPSPFTAASAVSLPDHDSRAFISTVECDQGRSHSSGDRSLAWAPLCSHSSSGLRFGPVCFSTDGGFILISWLVRQPPTWPQPFVDSLSFWPASACLVPSGNEPYICGENRVRSVSGLQSCCLHLDCILSVTVLKHISRLRTPAVRRWPLGLLSWKPG